MAIKQRQYTVIVGTQLALEIAQGEACEFQITFIEPPASPNAGDPVDFTDLQDDTAIWTVKDRQGVELFSRVGSVVGIATAGTLSWTLTPVDTQNAAVQTYRSDIDWTDTDDNPSQILCASQFRVLEGVGAPGDDITSPPANPVVYGLRWRGLWNAGTRYLINDAISYPDPNGVDDPISSFRCLVANTNVPPVNLVGIVSSDWFYLSEHGANGNSLPSGADGEFLGHINGNSSWVTLTLDMIAAAYTIISFALTGSSTVEVGASVVNPAFTASYNRPAALVTLDDGSGSPFPVALTLPATAFAFGSAPLSGKTYQSNTPNASQAFTLRANESGGPVKTATVSIAWRPRVFFGTAAAGTFNAAFIHALPSNGLQPSFAATYAFGAPSGTQYGYLAWPSSYGTPSAFTDPSTGFTFPMTRVATGVSVTNGNGVALNYDVWQTTFALGGAASVRAA